MKLVASGRAARIVDCLPPHRPKDGDQPSGPSLALTIGVVLVLAVAMIVELLKLWLVD